VQKYLESKFGDALEDVSNPLLRLCRNFIALRASRGIYALYEELRPEIDRHN
jgi:hypothetical protein